MMMVVLTLSTQVRVNETYEKEAERLKEIVRKSDEEFDRLAEKTRLDIESASSAVSVVHGVPQYVLLSYAC